MTRDLPMTRNLLQNALNFLNELYLKYFLRTGRPAHDGALDPDEIVIDPEEFLVRMRWRHVSVTLRGCGDGKEEKLDEILSVASSPGPDAERGHHKESQA